MSLSTQAILDGTIALLEDKKAEAVTVLDLKPFRTFTDYFVVASVNSGRQMMAIAATLQEHFKKESLSVGVEGDGSSDWTLVDLGPVVVHLMRPEARAFYQLESIWSRSPR